MASRNDQGIHDQVITQSSGKNLLECDTSGLSELDKPPIYKHGKAQYLSLRSGGTCSRSWRDATIAWGKLSC